MLPTRSTTSSPRSTAGLTLVEVVAALVILGTLLVGVVLAQARHTRQLAESQARHAAARAADALIAEWWARPEGVPEANDAGEVVADDGRSYRWRTRRVEQTALETLGARVLRVELRADAAADGDEPMMAVDLVLPDAEWEAQRLEALREEAQAIAATLPSDTTGEASPETEADATLDGVNRRGVTSQSDEGGASP